MERSIAFLVDGAEAGAFTLRLRLGVLEVHTGTKDEDAVTATIRCADKAALVDYPSGTRPSERPMCGRDDGHPSSELRSNLNQKGVTHV